MHARILISALALGGTMLTGCASQPAPPPQSVAGTTTGTITFTGGAVALGIGYQWGSGVLTYGGVDYPFKVSGLSVIDVGASRVTGTGRPAHASPWRSARGDDGRHPGRGLHRCR